MLLAKLASLLDAAHALLMVAWLAGLPLLFWRRYPKITRCYGAFAVVFVALSQASHYVLGECFLTALSRKMWIASGIVPPAGAKEWFTIRLAELVFHFTPSHRSIVVASEIMVLMTAIGILFRANGTRRARGVSDRNSVAV